MAVVSWEFIRSCPASPITAGGGTSLFFRTSKVVGGSQQARDSCDTHPPLMLGKWPVPHRGGTRRRMGCLATTSSVCTRTPAAIFGLRLYGTAKAQRPGWPGGTDLAGPFKMFQGQTGPHR